MKPTVGRLVIARGFESNGSREHPAVITRVHSDADPADGGYVSVNLHIFLDGAPTLVRQTIPMFESRDAAERDHRFAQTCFWPPRA